MRPFDDELGPRLAHHKHLDRHQHTRLERAHHTCGRLALSLSCEVVDVALHALRIRELINGRRLVEHVFEAIGPRLLRL